MPVVNSSPGKPVTLEALDEAMERLLGLHSLPAGWDSYGSPAIDARAVASGLLLLTQAALEGLPTPHVCPVSGGGVQLEWEIGARGLELEALPDGSVQFLKVQGDVMQEGPLDLPRRDDVRLLLRWLRGDEDDGGALNGRAR